MAEDYRPMLCVEGVPEAAGGIILFSFEVYLPGGGPLVQSNRDGHRAHALHSEVPDATTESSASRRTPLSPEQENGQRLAGYARDPPGAVDGASESSINPSPLRRIYCRERRVRGPPPGQCPRWRQTVNMDS
jgi:hypothetical protein